MSCGREQIDTTADTTHFDDDAADDVCVCVSSANLKVKHCSKRLSNDATQQSHGVCAVLVRDSDDDSLLCCVLV